MVLDTLTRQQLGISVYERAMDFVLAVSDDDRLDKVTPEEAETLGRQVALEVAKEEDEELDEGYLTMLTDTFVEAVIGHQAVYRRFLRKYGLGG